MAGTRKGTGTEQAAAECTNVFKNGELTKEAYTAAWIRLINRMEEEKQHTTITRR